MTVYPWQQDNWQKIERAITQGRLPHALLLHGADGIGLKHFADCLIAYLLCSARAIDSACGQCKDCQLYQAAYHPDLWRSAAVASSKQIKVDAIRSLLDFLLLTRHTAMLKIAVINECEKMNASAANALLKRLEEPPDDTLLLLLSNHPGRLLSTIRSRCQQLYFAPPDANIAKDWLVDKVADPATLLRVFSVPPLKAIQIDKQQIIAQCEALLADLINLQQQQLDPLLAAKKWQQNGIILTLECLLHISMEMLRIKCRSTGMQFELIPLEQQMVTLINRLSLEEILAKSESAQHNLSMLTGQTALNGLGLLEELAIQWHDIVTVG